jgi:signal transduction histidine kinase
MVSVIADRDPEAPGLRRARKRSIPVAASVEELLACHKADLIVDVTGNPAVSRWLATQRWSGTEILGGVGAKLLWNLVQHEGQMQTQLCQAEKLATIGTFTSGIAHDINNLLFLLMSLAQNLSDEQDVAVVHEQADDMVGAVRRIATIVQELTRFARVPHSEEWVEVELAGTLDEAVQLARYAVGFNDIEVVRKFSDRSLVRGRPEEFLQVFVNLIANSMQAMQGRGTLHVSTSRNNGTVAVAISDSGPGIPPHMIERIFEPFFTTKQPGEGTGLGLHICQTLVKKFGGHIAVSSQEGHGTTFQLQFPVEAT